MFVGFCAFSINFSSRGFINLISTKEQFNVSAISIDKLNMLPKEKITNSDTTSLINLALPISRELKLSEISAPGPSPLDELLRTWIIVSSREHLPAIHQKHP